MSYPVISICHPSARPHKWSDTMQEWLHKCTRPENVEYVLAVHATEDLRAFGEPDAGRWGAASRVINDARCCSVDGWNCAARSAGGQLLVGIADDFFPPVGWDEKILAAIPDLTGEYVLGASMGRPDRLLTHYIVTRKRYERLGYLLYPGYTSVFCDNEFTAVAKRDGVIAEAWDLQFEHRHPDHGHGSFDEVYRRENAATRYAEDGALFRQREAAGFPPLQLCDG